MMPAAAELPPPPPVRAAAPPDARRHLADEFADAIRKLKRRFERALPEDLRLELGEVTSYQLDALMCSMSRADGIAMNDLAREQGVRLSTCTALADRLVKHGLAERVSDPGDRRVVRLRATVAGRDLVERWRTGRTERIAAVLAPLDDAEVTQLVHLLRRVACAAPEPAQ